MEKKTYISVILPLKLEWEPCYSVPENMDASATWLQQAQYTRDAVIPAMNDVRAAADALEVIVGKAHWPMPTYQDLLTSI